MADFTDEPIYLIESTFDTTCLPIPKFKTKNILPYFKTLLILFWTKRNICHSFREIAEDCGLVNRRAAMILMYMLQSFGLLTINKQKYKGKHCGRNWYKLTTKGQKLIKLILNKAFRGTPVPVEALPIEFKKNYPVWIKEPPKPKSDKVAKDFFKQP